MLRRLLIQKLEHHASKWLVLGIDLLIVAFIFFASYIFRFSITYDFLNSHFFYQLGFVLVLSLFCFLTIGSYRGVIRQTGIKDAYKLLIALSMLWLIINPFVKINRIIFGIHILNIPFSVVNIFCVSCLGALIISRVLFKYAYTYTKYILGQSSQVATLRVLIYGTDEPAVRTLYTLVNNSEKLITVVGFVENSKKRGGRTINGIDIYNSKEIDKHFILNKCIDEIIISKPEIDSNKLTKIYDRFTTLGLKVKIIPGYKNWVDGKLNVSQIKQIQIEDLLNRSPIKIDNDRVNKEFRDKTILITGAAGSIGSELTRQIALLEYKNLILLDQAESELYNLQQDLISKGFSNFKCIVANIKDASLVESVFSLYLPNVIFHAAAYKHVPMMEEFPLESVKTNISGTCTLADLSLKYNVEKFVFVSTDKAVNPTNVMGATKRAAEMYLQSLHSSNKTKFITTRFGNVLGSNGSVIPLFKKQIENGGPVLVTHKEITRYFMTIPEASRLVIEAGSMGKGGEIFLFDMGKSVKIFDLAKRMIALSGFNYPEDIDIKISGLRPGEKLYEELLADSENSLPTYHEKIMISKSSTHESLKRIAFKITELRNMDSTVSNKSILLKIKDLVPEYEPKNPVYSLKTRKVS